MFLDDLANLIVSDLISAKAFRAESMLSPGRRNPACDQHCSSCLPFLMVRPPRISDLPRQFPQLLKPTPRNKFLISYSFCFSDRSVTDTRAEGPLTKLLCQFFIANTSIVQT